MANSPLSLIPTSQRSAREELAERTRALLIEAQTAGPARRQQILDEVVTSHLWLAEKLARHFLHRGEDEEDLVQVAYTGLFVIMDGPCGLRVPRRSSPRSSGDGGQRWFRKWVPSPARRISPESSGRP